MRTKRGERWVRTALQGAVAIAFLGLLGLALPESAQAGDDFERGFKRELGAIAAHEAVGIGRHIVGDIVGGHYPHRPYRESGYYGRRHHRSDYYRPYRRGYRSYGVRRPYRRHRVVHEHHHYYEAPCDY